MKTAKVLRPVPFLGKNREVNDVITAEELSMLTPQTINALVNEGILEIEGQKKDGGEGLSADEASALRTLQASFDNFRETMTNEVASLHKKLDAIAKPSKAAKSK